MKAKDYAVGGAAPGADSFVIRGNIVHTPTREKFDIHEDCCLVVENGKVAGIFARLPQRYASFVVEDHRGDLIIPGFSDLHVHAPQFYLRGLGMDYELLDWLDKNTFPREKKLEDMDYARKIYGDFADALARCGTLRAAVFGTVHTGADLLLAELLKKKGLAALVGKVNQDMNSPKYLTEDTKKSLEETEEFIRSGVWTDRVRPIITPRFAVTCTDRLLEGLGKLAAKYKVSVQSHLSENKDEIAQVAQLFPKAKDYADVYDMHGLLGQRPTLMAHCIHLSEREIARMAKSGTIAVHCPDSNLNLKSGIMPLRRLMAKGVKAALGSDVGGGHDLFMPRTIVRAVQVSKMNFILHPDEEELSLPEAFYLATKGGGQFFGRAGSFEKGSEADILVVKDPGAETVLESIEKFIYTGSADDILARYAAGRRIDQDI